DLSRRIRRIRKLLPESDAKSSSRIRLAVDMLSAFHREFPSLHSIDTPQGLIHGDFWYGNIVTSSGRPEAWGVLDFDESHIGPLLLDVAQFADLTFAISRAGGKIGFNLRFASDFARRYASESAIDVRVLRDLPLVLLAARLCSACWLLERRVADNDNRAESLL